MDVSSDERVHTPRGAGWLAFAGTVLVVSLATYGGRRSPGSPVPA